MRTQSDFRRRLRKAVGLAGVAVGAMGSGPCSNCVDDYEYESCATLDEMRQAIVANAMRDNPVSVPTDVDGGLVRTDAGVEAQSPVTSQAVNAMAASLVSCPSRVDYNDLVEESGSYGWNIPEHPFRDSSEPGRTDGSSQKLEGECCYPYTFVDHCPGGRPFLVNGVARTADWVKSVSPGKGPTDRLTEAFRRKVAEAWRSDALMEHASVAAFARLTLELMQHRAPMALVAASQKASLDELAHARICKEQSNKFSSQACEFGVLATADCLVDSSLESFIERNVVEGCVGETLASIEAAERAQLALDPALSRDLARIARDEAEHSELAWRILAWCLQQHPKLTRKVLVKVQGEQAPSANHSVPKAWSHKAVARWEEQGLLTPRASYGLRGVTWQNTLGPLFGELLSSTRSGDSSSQRVVGAPCAAPV